MPGRVRQTSLPIQIKPRQFAQLPERFLKAFPEMKDYQARQAEYDRQWTQELAVKLGLEFLP